MKILVTGGAGFIGSNVADVYISSGHRVIVVDNLSSGKKRNLNPKARFYKVDITDKKAISAIFAKEKFDVVNHHAAQIDVRKSVADPSFDARVNILGTINLLESCIKNKVKKFIFASSGGTIYGECGKNAPDEKAPAGPASPYGISKLSVEFYLKYYSLLYGLKYTSLRYGNVYGPRQDPHGEAGVVAIFSNKLLNREKIAIFGNGKQMRDYVYVKDVARANLLALKRGHNQVINIATNKSTSVNELYTHMAKITGFKAKPIYKPERPGELFKSFLNIKKAKSVLNWAPKFHIRKGLENTIQYFSK